MYTNIAASKLVKIYYFRVGIFIFNGFELLQFFIKLKLKRTFMNKLIVSSLFALTLSGCVGSADKDECSGEECQERKEINGMKSAGQPFDESNFKLDVIPDYGDEGASQELPDSLFSMTQKESKKTGVFAENSQPEISAPENSVRSMALTQNYTPGCYTFFN